MFNSPTSLNNQQQNHNNLQIHSAFSINDAVNSPVSISSCNQQLFTDSMMTSSESFSSFFNLSDTGAATTVDINDIFDFNSTAGKRRIVFENDEEIQRQHSKTNIRIKNTPRNEEYQRTINLGFVRINGTERKVFSCFIGNCRFKAHTSERFEKHMNYFHDDQRDVLHGFCMICENFDCGGSIYEEFLHLYEHISRGGSVNSNKMFIKKEAECDIGDETYFCDQNETILSCVGVDEDISSDENLIPMEPPSSLAEKIESESTPIKQEPVVREDLNATIKIHYDLEEKCAGKSAAGPEREKQSVPVTEFKEREKQSVPVTEFKMPIKSHINRTLRKRAMSTFQNSDSIKAPSKRKSQTTEDIKSQTVGNFNDPLNESSCLEFISKKIKMTKSDDKFKDFKPNESILNLGEEQDAAVPSKENKKRPEEEMKKRSGRKKVENEKLKKKFSEFNEKRKEFNSKKSKSVDESFSNSAIGDLLERISASARSKTEQNKKKITVEVEDLWKSSKVDKQQPKSSIAEYFQSKPLKTPKTRKSEEIFDDIQSNFNEGLMQQMSKEKTPTKNSARKQSGGSELKIVPVDLEDVHPKYKQKLPEKQPALRESSSFNDKSLNSSSRSLPEPYIVDMEALIKKASSSTLEFESLKELYPWIDEAITSVIFKTKSSIDILLNELCLFSTYKCMNELCYFFTTDFEEFKTHARKHDANNNYCSYCLQNFDKSIDLCSHLDVAHRFDRFQCNKCMYRSCQKGYVDVHQKVHHPVDENCEVLKSPVQKLLKSDRSRCLTALSKNREKFVQPYRCKTPRCKDSFFSKDNFRRHLESESNKSNYQEFVTLICQQLTAIDHSKTSTNSEGIFQCLHCQYGRDDSDAEIFTHMALNHPNEFAYVCKRVKPQKLIELNIVSARETIENSTSIEYVAGGATAEARSYEGDLKKLNSTNSKADGKKCLVVSEVISVDE